MKTQPPSTYTQRHQHHRGGKRSSALNLRHLALASLALAATLILITRIASGQPQPAAAAAEAGAESKTAAAASSADAGAAASAAAAAASADGGSEDGGEKKDEIKRFDLEGYVNAGVGATSRPRALPRDRLTYGLRSSLAGIIVKGTPFEKFSYIVHFGVNPEAVAVVTDVSIVDKAGDQTNQGTSTKTTDLTIVPVEEVSITYTPVEWLSIKGGHFYMPFSPAASVIVTSQMFPTRPQSTQLFMVGADQGLLASVTLLDERIQVSAGAFNGSSLELRVPETTPLAPVWNAFLDVHPLGKMPRVEGDPARGPFRFALGGGALYRTGVLFDSTGYESTRFREVRVDGALRVSFRGLFVQAEYLRRLQTDDLSGRPASATGAYAQASYFQPIIGNLALAPLARYGYAREDEMFAPRKITELELGVAIYPRADLDEPDKLRFILQYDGEFREPESEVAHGGVLHMQLRW